MRVPGGAGLWRACATGVPSWRRWPWSSSPLPGGSRSSRTAAPAHTGPRCRRSGPRPRRPSWTPPSPACCHGTWRHRSAVRWWCRDRRASSSCSAGSRQPARRPAAWTWCARTRERRGRSARSAPRCMMEAAMRMGQPAGRPCPARAAGRHLLGRGPVPAPWLARRCGSRGRRVTKLMDIWRENIVHDHPGRAAWSSSASTPAARPGKVPAPSGTPCCTTPMAGSRSFRRRERRMPGGAVTLGLRLEAVRHSAAHC